MIAPVGKMLVLALLGQGHDVTLVRHRVGALDGVQPCGHPHLTGGDGLPVAPAVGALGPARAEPLDLADVGLSLARLLVIIAPVVAPVMPCVIAPEALPIQA